MKLFIQLMTNQLTGANLFPRFLVAFLVLFSIQVTANVGSSHNSFNVTVSGKGQDVILIPGLMSDASVWSVLAKELTKTHKLHLVNIAGFGATPKIEGQSLEKVKLELFEYIEQNKLNQPTIIGHSLGGFMAFWMASSSPEKIGRIISVDGLPFIGPVFTGSNNSTVKSLGAQANQMRAYFSHLSASQLDAQNRRSINRQATSKESKEKIITMASQSDPAIVGSLMFTLMSTDLRDKISEIKNPALLIGAAGGFGNNEAKMEAKKLYQQQLSKLKGAKLVMNNNSRHFIMFDQPEWLTKQVIAFLSDSK